MNEPNLPISPNFDTLYQDIRQLIESAKAHVVSQVNQAVGWRIGYSMNTGRALAIPA